MECSSVMVGKIMRERCTHKPKAHETPKQCMHTLKDSYPGAKKVSKTIRKKDYNAYARLNGLATVCMSKENNKVYG